jgi:hypothetical protein
LARQGQVPLHYGEILSEDAGLKLELSKYGELLAASENVSYNALLANHFAHEFGHEHLFRLATEDTAMNSEKTSGATLKVPTLLASMSHEHIMQRIKEGWKVKALRISDEYLLSLYQTEQGTWTIPIISVTPLHLIMHGNDGLLPSERGYTLIVFAPPDDSSGKTATA